MGIKTFALDIDKYTFENVMCWGLYAEHVAKVSSRDSGDGKWFGHLIIAIIEWTPIISQIASIFEAAIVLVAYAIFPENASLDRTSSQSDPLASKAALLDVPPTQPISDVATSNKPVASDSSEPLTASAAPVVETSRLVVQIVGNYATSTAPPPSPPTLPPSLPPVVFVVPNSEEKLPLAVTSSTAVGASALVPRHISIPRLDNYTLTEVWKRDICGVNTAIQMLAASPILFTQFEETIRLWTEKSQSEDPFFGSERIRGLLRQINVLILELKAQYYGGVGEFPYNLDLNPIRELLYEFAHKHQKMMYKGDHRRETPEQKRAIGSIKAAPWDVINDLVWGLRVGLNDRYPVGGDYHHLKFQIKGVRDWTLVGTEVYIPETFEAALKRVIQGKGLQTMPEHLIVFRDNQGSNTEIQPVPMTFISNNCSIDQRVYEYELKSFSFTSRGDSHYYAFIKQQERWFLCNDGEVEEISVANIQRWLTSGRKDQHEPHIRGTTMFRNFIYERKRELVASEPLIT